MHLAHRRTSHGTTLKEGRPRPTGRLAPRGAPIDALERAALARERDELRGRIAVLEYNSLVHEKAARAAATKAQRLQAAAALTGLLLARRGEGVASAFAAWEKLLS